MAIVVEEFMNNPGYSLEVDDVFQEAKAGSKKVFTAIQGYKPSKIKIYGMSRLAVYRRPLSLGRIGILAEERIVANLLLKWSLQVPEFNCSLLRHTLHPDPRWLNYRDKSNLGIPRPPSKYL